MKLPRTATRMKADALALKRAVAALNAAMGTARKSPDSEEMRTRVRALAWEVERLSTCIRADAIDIQSATNADDYGE